MTRHWMTATMILLAASLLAVSGCVKKKQPAAVLGGVQDVYDDGRLITGWNPDGTPIYAEDGSTLDFRPEGAETSLNQFEPVYFDYDSQQVSSFETAKIDAVVGYLQQNPTYGVIVEGHCDERGSNEYNMSLGEQRALAVRASLISRGIDPNRVATRTYGEERPVAFGHDESSWRLNRRAEFSWTQM
jgi:peptidoglycan-associated lipoprotein